MNNIKNTKMVDYTEFWKKYPDLFIEDMYGIKLTLFQKWLIRLWSKK